MFNSDQNTASYFKAQIRKGSGNIVRNGGKEHLQETSMCNRKVIKTKGYRK